MDISEKEAFMLLIHEIINKSKELEKLFSQITIIRADTDAMEKIKTRLEEITREKCTGFNAKYEFNYLKQYPPTINDAAFNTFLKEIAVIVKNMENVIIYIYDSGGILLGKTKSNYVFYWYQG